MEWGSVADWVAAFGTTGALLATLGILEGDRRRKRREEADLLIVWYRKVTPRGNDLLLVSIHNSTGHPLPHPKIHIWTGQQWEVTDTTPPNPDYSLMPLAVAIDSQERLEQTVVNREVDDTAAREFYVEFYDSRGRRWTRNILSGRYVSARKFARLKSRPSTAPKSDIRKW